MKLLLFDSFIKFNSKCKNFIKIIYSTKSKFLSTNKLFSNIFLRSRHFQVTRHYNVNHFGKIYFNFKIVSNIFGLYLANLNILAIFKGISKHYMLRRLVPLKLNFSNL